MPVALPLLMLLHCSWWGLCRIGVFVVYHMQYVAVDQWGQAGLVMVVVATAFLVTFPLQSRIGAQLVHQLCQLPAQLKVFSINEAECSCCSQGHLHPETGAAVPCDRELVYRALEQTHGQPGDSLEECLKAFSTAVRTELGQRILRAWGSGALPLRSFVFMTFSMNFPFLLSTLPHIASQVSSHSSIGTIVAISLQNLLGWASSMPCMLFYLWFCNWAWSHGRHPTWPVLFEVASMLSVMAGITLIWLVLAIPLQLQLPFCLLGSVVFPIVMAAGFYLLRQASLGPVWEAVEGSRKDGQGWDEASCFSI